MLARLLPTTFLAGALLLQGCGGTGADLTRAQFTKRADAICQRAKERRDERMAAVIEAAPPARSELIATQVKAQLAAVDPYEAATAALEDLGAPKGGDVERLLAAREEAAESVREAPATAYFSNYPYRRANDLADTYGLTECRTEN
ncbi:MAG TPA: hypothetical protein VFT79_08295 [Solirubrobacterales bacterium]|nr:hypothetical protein [Solirubrobacterales bacterium]